MMPHFPPYRRSTPLLITTGAVLFLSGCATTQEGLPAAGDESACPAPGQWVERDGTTMTTAEVVKRAADYDVILLGEEHGNQDQHRWQLHTLSALQGQTIVRAVGLEMLPRDRQPSLDQWLAGDRDEAAFLRESEWYEHWGHPPEGYLPLLHLARMERIPLRALNLDRETHGRLAGTDWDDDASALEGIISRPATPHPDYRDRLIEALERHPHAEVADQERFVRAQLVWDRAMAEGLHEALDKHGGPVVGIMGRGHVEYGHGVPEQLADLGVGDVLVLLPHATEEDCEPPDTALADFTYSYQPGTGSADAPLRLGIMVESAETGLEVTQVSDGSAADDAGIRAGDILLEAGGEPVNQHSELLIILNNARKGFALPIKISRNGDRKDLLARFENGH